MSAQVKTKKHDSSKNETFITRKSGVESVNSVSDVEAAENKEQRSQSPSQESDINGQMTFEPDQESSFIDIQIRRPEHVDAFSQDLRTMHMMESEFKDRITTLQKKIGISNGLI